MTTPDPESITIFNSPLTSLAILSKIAKSYSYSLLSYLNKHRFLLFFTLTTLSCLYLIPGPQQPLVQFTEEFLIFALWWIMLGVASSIGLGTGLHTFVLYLGPHIAQVTLVAYECQGIPKMLPSRWNYKTFDDCPPPAGPLSIWDIVQTVQLECFLWGLGTALGELPPYFIALGARLANTKAEELEELDNESGFIQKAKSIMERCLKHYGFITVLLCASIPNPLFDLAGLLCGHFGIPLWKFLGATIIGKAGFKVHIQMFFTIFMCGESHIDHLVGLLEKNLSFLGTTLSSALAKHKKMLHSPNMDSHERTIISMLWELFIVGMIFFFIISILNSLVRGEICKELGNKNPRRRKRNRGGKKNNKSRS